MEWKDEFVRRLIAAVRLNPGLYAKGSRVYKDTEAKRLAWETIAFQIHPSCSGDMASKRFKSLRDAFVKENKLITAETNLPSGSGGGAENTYVPSEFYNDLFLKEHIGTRRTTSNICIPPSGPKRPLEIPTYSQLSVPIPTFTLLDSIVIRPSAGNDRPVTSTPVIDRTSDSGLDTVFTPIHESTASESDFMMEISACEEVANMAEPHPCPSPSTSSVSSGRGFHNSLIRSKAVAALKTPPPDMKSKKKKNEPDEAAKALDQLNETAKAVMEKINNSTENK